MGYFAYLEYPYADFNAGKRTDDGDEFASAARWMKFVEDKMGHSCHQIAWATAQYLRGKTLQLWDGSHYTVHQAAPIGPKSKGWGEHIVTQVVDNNKQELWLDIQGVVSQDECTIVSASGHGSANRKSNRHQTSINHEQISWNNEQSTDNVGREFVKQTKGGEGNTVIGIFCCPRLYTEVWQEIEYESSEGCTYERRSKGSGMELSLPLELESEYKPSKVAIVNYHRSRIVDYIQFWMSDKSNDFDCHDLTRTKRDGESEEAFKKARSDAVRRQIAFAAKINALRARK